jgi:hypothetical protein
MKGGVTGRFEVNSDLNRQILLALASAAENPSQAALLGHKPITTDVIAESFDEEVLAAWRALQDARSQFHFAVGVYLNEHFPEIGPADPDLEQDKQEANCGDLTP